MGSVPALKDGRGWSGNGQDEVPRHPPHRVPSSANRLYDTGELAKLPGVRVMHHEQGHGIVNTIGAMNGFRVLT